MTASVLALSISGSITKYGAYAGFASILGLAVLSLLYFAQAREVRRLREWAGRAPERAAELEQRVSDQAAARARPGVPVGAVPARAVSAAVPSRVAGTVTPVAPGTAPAAGASPATAAAGGAAAGPHPAGGVPAGPAGAPAPGGVPPAQSTVPAVAGTPGPAPGGQATPAVPSIAAAASTAPPGSASTGEASGARDAPSPGDGSTPADGAPLPPAVLPPTPAGPHPAGGAGAPRPLTPIEAELESAEAAGEAEAEKEAATLAQPAGNGAEPADEEDVPAVVGQPFAAAPATAAAAARAAGTPPAGWGPAGRAPSMPAAAAGEPSVGLPLPPAPGGSRRPAAPAMPPRRLPGASSGGRGDSPESRLQELGSRPDRSSPGARIAVLAIVGVVVVVLVLLFVVLHGSHSATPTTASGHKGHAASSRAARHSAAAPATSPATLPVVVLNGTSVNGLAHHLAGDLTQNGYNDASPQTASPGTNTPTSTVYYASGDRADAQGVAQVLGMSTVAPITAAIRAISGAAPVVVVAGMDQASALDGTASSASGTAAGG